MKFNTALQGKPLRLTNYFCLALRLCLQTTSILSTPSETP